MSTLAVTVYQGRAGDHNPRALVGARVLGRSQTVWGSPPS
jgi:hypothetical protein